MNRYFLITIDTEGDNLWSRPKKVTTENAKFIPRFQELCEKYRLKPTYLTNFEMARSPFFAEYAGALLKGRKAEIGMHLHAWDSPPEYQLSANDQLYHPYLIEYPHDIMQQKITFMTLLLENTFGVKINSHRSGRWSINEKYVSLLHKSGYKIDCSVTPHRSWKNTPGDPAKSGGTDFTGFPEDAYFVDPADISRAGNSDFLEIPMTYHLIKRPFLDKYIRGPLESSRFCSRLIDHFFRRVIYLTPDNHNLNEMLRIIERSVRIGKGYVQLTLHSSELMPGGSPWFRTNKDIDMLFCNIEKIFSVACREFTGATLTEYYENSITNISVCNM